METTTRKIGNSVGAIFPKEISPEVGVAYVIDKFGDSYVITPKKENIFKDTKAWEGFRDSVTSEDNIWDVADLT